MGRLFGLLTVDVIMRTAFGLEAEIQTNPDTELVHKAFYCIRCSTLHPSSIHVSLLATREKILQHKPHPIRSFLPENCAKRAKHQEKMPFGKKGPVSTHAGCQRGKSQRNPETNR